MKQYVKQTFVSLAQETAGDNDGVDSDEYPTHFIFCEAENAKSAEWLKWDIIKNAWAESKRQANDVGIAKIY